MSKFVVKKGILKKCSGTDINITIPDGVTSIGAEAFEDCENVQSITIPNGVTSIGEMAFLWCKNLQSVVIPNGVISIGAKAFSGCKNLQSINIPDSVISIGGYAFYKCENIQNVNIPNSVVSIGECAFKGCKKLADENGMIIQKNILFDYCGQSSEVTIPNGVTSIDAVAFSGCKNLQSINIPDSVISIGSYAFDECEKLQSVIIPNGVVSIGNNAFEGCNLQQVLVPQSVKFIGHQAFSKCKDIIVYDTIDPDAADCKSKVDLINGYPNSELGFVGIGKNWAKWECVLNHHWSDHVITVKSAETDAVKYKVYMVADPGQRNYQCLLTSSWGHNATFNFEALDDFFSKIKYGKCQVALSRLLYKVDLSAEMETKYKKYICRIAEEAIRFCIDTEDMEYLRVCSEAGAIKAKNIDEMLAYANEKGKTEIAAYLLECGNGLDRNIDSFALSSELAEKPRIAKKAKVWTVIKQKNGTGLISKYSGNDTEIEFPLEVDGVKIWGIATRRGATPDNYKNLKSVVIPEGYAVIGNKAFEGCIALENVELASTVTRIGNEAFSGCTSLEKIILPPRTSISETATDSGKAAFSGCTNLKEIIITDISTYLSGSSVFKGVKDYTIYTPENAHILEENEYKKYGTLTADMKKEAADIYYKVPRTRTVVCTETGEGLPSVGDILQIKTGPYTMIVYGHKIETMRAFAANSEGVFFGIPQFDQIDEYGNEDFADDMALYSFAEYVVAKVVSKPRKYKKHKCFDIEISVKD